MKRYTMLAAQDVATLCAQVLPQGHPRENAISRGKGTPWPGHGHPNEATCASLHPIAFKKS